MARRQTPTTAASRVLSAADKRAAIARLETRIKEIGEIDTSGLQRGDDPAVQSVEARIKSTLASIFGEGTPEYRRLVLASDLDATTYVLTFDGRGTPPHEIQEGVSRGMQRATALLNGEVDALRESLEFETSEPDAKAVMSATLDAVPSEDVFVVHGRDDAAKTEVASVIERAGLRAIILHQQPNEGKTIIEKFEKHGGGSGFAVVVLTPDDLGGVDDKHLRSRARQNVIGEMFWFAGRLGRERVCALIKGNIEMPSDFAGVGYTPMDSHGAWKAKLLQELDAAGYKNLDWKKALA